MAICGQDRLFVAADAGEERLVRFELPQQVAAHLVLDAAIGSAAGPCHAPPLAECGWFSSRGFGGHKVPFLLDTFGAQRTGVTLIL